MTLRSRALLLAMAALAVDGAHAQPGSPATQAYQQLQAMRGAADDLVDASAKARPSKCARRSPSSIARWPSWTRR